MSMPLIVKESLSQASYSCEWYWRDIVVAYYKKERRRASLNYFNFILKVAERAIPRVAAVRVNKRHHSRFLTWPNSFKVHSLQILTSCKSPWKDIMDLKVRRSCGSNQNPSGMSGRHQVLSLELSLVFSDPFFWVFFRYWIRIIYLLFLSRNGRFWKFSMCRPRKTPVFDMGVLKSIFMHLSCSVPLQW